MKKKFMDVVFLLDRSGSMSGSEEDTIGGYNNYLKDFKDKDVRITTVLFDDKYEMLTDKVNSKDVPQLDKSKYYVRGTTALLDALGKTISYMDREKNDKVMFIITTDGYENASREYTKDKIKNMIEKHPKWEFLYIGADIDSYSEGASIGIRQDRISNYKKGKEGTDMMFGALRKASMSYMADEELSTSWKEELEDYIKNTKE